MSTISSCELLFICVATTVCTNCAAQEIQVQRWHPHDFEFRSQTEHENPFAVQFSATVNGPDGLEFSTLGFYDGDGTWNVRFSPNTEGEWSLLTHSDEPELDGKSAKFVCIQKNDKNVHGGLLVDTEFPHHFVFEDGTRHFQVGYECDWLWALDMNDPILRFTRGHALPTLNPFLDKLVENGFNLIILNGYAHDTGWCRGNTSDDDYGPPPMYAWQGSNENPEHSRFNLAYWQHYDRVIDALYQRGIVAHIMIKVYNKMVNWPKTGSAEDNRYFRWLIARYAAYPNVVWDFSKEAHNEKNLEYKLNRFRLIRENDPYHRLITDHDDDRAYDSGAYDELLDFRSDQNHSNWHKKILRQREQNRWPVVNVEFGYEHGPKGLDDKTYGRAQEPKEVYRRAWEICMAGGYVAYYYTYTAWDVIRPEDTPPGYAYFKRLREFFETTGYWRMTPADELVSDGYCLANPGNEYIVFLNEAKNFTLKLGELSEPLKAEWFQPFTGDREDAGQFTSGKIELAPPADWGKIPIVLHVKR